MKYRPVARLFCVGGSNRSNLGTFYDYAWIILRSRWIWPFWGGVRWPPWPPPGYGPEIYAYISMIISLWLNYPIWSIFYDLLKIWPNYTTSLLANHVTYSSSSPSSGSGFVPSIQMSLSFSLIMPSHVWCCVLATMPSMNNWKHKYWYWNDCVRKTKKTIGQTMQAPSTAWKTYWRLLTIDKLLKHSTVKTFLAEADYITWKLLGHYLHLDTDMLPRTC